MSDNGTMREFTSQERAALIAWHLAHGEAMTTLQVSELTGSSRQGAYKLMIALSRVLPIYQDENGFWQVCALREAGAQQ
jgi:hypothetical protein